MPDQEEIARKYATAFDEMGRQDVQVSEMRMHGDKLYVLAWASTQEAKNNVWDRIKSVDPSYADLICDIRIGREQDVTNEFDQAVQSAPKGALATGLAAAFRSDTTPSFSSMLSRLFEKSDGQQRAGLLNSLFATAPSSVASEVLGMFGGKKQVTAEEAKLIPPDAVQRLAESAEKSNPSVVDRVSDFYAEHPGLVKMLGVGALSVMVPKIIGGLRGKSGGAQ